MGELTITTFLTLVRSTVTSAGAVLSVYRRAGTLRTGSFELPEK